MTQLREFAQHKKDFEERKVRIVALSVDDLPHARQVWEIVADRSFTILSDPRAKLCRHESKFGFDDRLHYQMATAIDDSDHHRFLVHVHADILNVTTRVSCLLGGKLIPFSVYLSPKVQMPLLRPPY